nr:MAG TPA: hypothetical protein [Caudoviricetes sp.]
MQVLDILLTFCLYFKTIQGLQLYIMQRIKFGDSRDRTGDL